jgi:hypothetical protein
MSFLACSRFMIFVHCREHTFSVSVTLARDPSAAISRRFNDTVATLAFITVSLG